MVHVIIRRVVGDDHIGPRFAHHLDKRHSGGVVVVDELIRDVHPDKLRPAQVGGSLRLLMTDLAQLLRLQHEVPLLAVGGDADDDFVPLLPIAQESARAQDLDIVGVCPHR